MKFARYLDDAQTPEWKKAYIDYHGLKKRIAAIRRAREELNREKAQQSETDDTEVEVPNADLKNDTGDGGEDADDEHEVVGRDAQDEIRSSIREAISPAEVPNSDLSSPTPSASSAQASPGIPHPRRPLGAVTSLRRRSTARVPRVSEPVTPVTHMSSLHNPPFTLSEILEGLSSIEAAFFQALDAELVKIEAFFLAREAEARERSRELRLQLLELQEHRRAYYAAHGSQILPVVSRAPKRIRRALHHESTAKPNKDAEKPSQDDAQESRLHPGKIFEPDEYLHARKKLKRAVLEHYRGLEVLNNYRILNLTGFRKALKKFEKLTKIPVQAPYMSEKVEPCAFASDELVQKLLKEMENQFSARFMRGNRKRALVRLRAINSQKTHHFSTLRSGLMLGLAVPALVDGIVRIFQHETRAAIPGWSSLLFVYAILALPTMFALLVGVDALIWSEARINYVFIFELDIRTRVDHREYFEMPAVMFATLAYAFWLSFARIGPTTTWPLIWLAFSAATLVNPLPMFSRESRWWLVRNVARLVTSGWHRVEFTDFWLGDQFCSLTFTLGNLYFFACAYAVGFDTDPWTRCSQPSHWGVPFLLTTLPFLARLVQSIRRYADSRLITHLINGGKYGTGILYYFSYYYWRHHGGARGPSFVLWCLFGTIYATYASSWDLLMDWSLLRPHAKLRFLRSELVYSSYIPLYYCAIISNVLIRFIWVFYIPTSGPSFALRTWIAAMLEMLRRFQWNIYRLENEHLGNVDQYRITREVPLPYSFDDLSHDTDVGDVDDEEEVLEHKPVRPVAR